MRISADRLPKKVQHREELERAFLLQRIPELSISLFVHDLSPSRLETPLSASAKEKRENDKRNGQSQKQCDDPITDFSQSADVGSQHRKSPCKAKGDSFVVFNKANTVPSVARIRHDNCNDETNELRREDFALIDCQPDVN